MTTMRVRPRQVDNVIITDMTRGRILTLHDHRRWRVAKKYHRAMVFQRPVFLPANRGVLHDILRDTRPDLSDKALRRVCRALCKHGIDAKVER
jgi:hypothetical protein